MNDVGLEQAARRVVPADAAFEARDAARVERRDRPVPELELAALDREPQIVAELAPVGEPQVEVGAEELDPTLARVLRLVHRGVGAASSASGVVSAPGPTATPMLIPIVASASRSVIGSRHRRRRCAARCATASSTCWMFSSRITNSSPPKRATVSYGRTWLAQPRRDLGEHRVAGLVPEHVVHELEAVEVAIQHRELLRRARAPQHAVIEPVDEHLAPREPGEPVVVGSRDLELRDPPAQLCVLAAQRVDLGAARPCPTPPASRRHRSVAAVRPSTPRAIDTPCLAAATPTDRDARHRTSPRSRRCHQRGTLGIRGNRVPTRQGHRVSRPSSGTARSPPTTGVRTSRRSSTTPSGRPGPRNLTDLRSADVSDDHRLPTGPRS